MSDECDRLTLTPLSLQNQCLLYLACHITSFPISSLSLLPKHISFKLVRNLPAANISWLESTEFVHASGIDIQAVWRDVFTTRTLTPSYQWPLHKYFDEGQFLGVWKDHYMMRIFTALFNEVSGSELRSYKNYAFRLLFSVKECLGVFGHTKQMASSHYTMDADTGCITPLQYDKWWKSSMSGATIVQLVIQECCYRPKELHIVCNLFPRASIYLEKGRVSVLQDALSCVEELKLSCYTYSVIECDPTLGILMYLIEMIIAGGKSKLRNIIIDARLPIFENILSRIVPVFYNSSYKFHYFPTPSCLPCSNLVQLAISTHRTHNQLSRTIYIQLAQLIENQPSLQHIHLDGRFLTESINNTRGTKQFLRALSGFIMLPCFSKLTVELSNLSIQVARQLLRTYLISPSTQLFQRFALHDIVLRDDSDLYSPDIPSCITMEDSSLESKLVHFHNISPITPILESLFSLPCLRLRALDITTSSSEADILGMIGRHPNFQLKQLNLYAKLPRTSSTTRDVETILQKPELQAFNIYDCMDSNSYANLLSLTDVARGLLKQATVGHLYELSLEKNRLGQHPDVELEFFFDALFSFPSLGQLGVNLCGNELTAHHVTLLYDAWKNKGGGKCLRRLGYHDNEIPEDTWYLEQVASSVNY